MKKSEYDARKKPIDAAIKSLERQKHQLRFEAQFYAGSAEDMANVESAIAEQESLLRTLNTELRACRPPLILNHIYRAATPRQVGWHVNDRMIIYMDMMGWKLQYDSPSIRSGSRYPSVTVEDFLLWMSEDVTEGYPDGDWVEYNTYLAARKAA